MQRNVDGMNDESHHMTFRICPPSLQLLGRTHGGFTVHIPYLKLNSSQLSSPTCVHGEGFHKSVIFFQKQYFSVVSVSHDCISMEWGCNAHNQHKWWYRIHATHIFISEPRNQLNMPIIRDYHLQLGTIKINMHARHHYYHINTQLGYFIMIKLTNAQIRLILAK